MYQGRNGRTIRPAPTDSVSVPLLLHQRDIADLDWVLWIPVSEEARGTLPHEVDIFSFCSHHVSMLSSDRDSGQRARHGSYP